MTSRRSPIGVIALALLALASSSCGGTDGTSATSIATVAPTSSPPPTPSEATEATSPAASTATTPPAATTAGAPATTTASTTTTTATATTTGAAPPSADAVTLLVVDRRGVRLWSEGGERRLLRDRSVGSALPDRVGGIVYQELETGAWRPAVMPPSATASWRWVGSGSPQPIRWLRSLDGAAEIVVRAPADGWVQPVDTALVDGRPVLAYVRTRYTTVTATDGNPWWASAQAELVVHDLDTAGERVVRIQEVGWEYDQRDPALGGELVADAVGGYGGGVYLDLWTHDGTPVAVRFEPGSAVADLPPVGDALVQAVDRIDRTGVLVGGVDVITVDPRDGVETLRASIDTPPGAVSARVDTLGDRSLLLVGAPVSVAPPAELRRGDQGPWVVVLQQQLDEWLRGRAPSDQYLAPDGVFGPRTAAAVETVQAATGAPVTGTADAATWQEIGVPGSTLLDPILVEPDGSSRSVAVFDAAGAPLQATRVAPHLPGNVVVSLWSG